MHREAQAGPRLRRRGAHDALLDPDVERAGRGGPRRHPRAGSLVLKRGNVRSCIAEDGPT